ncbi:DNA polymerase III chi subunit [Nicoletella semolina]|uniref:DNA polymerase III chi subunit n=1 Tax=Nicoletella semolina TaxID=271160 RepID=A0A4R2N639_9PAST|nr:DNA polymerase III subunit chi [Nicoletella semolina]MDH2925287.1 DNA polymerase III subunit chi [Nicoletella semolina]TCP16372.1 DNA polymerase III chi subunit [Nicoletella semolina]
MKQVQFYLINEVEQGTIASEEFLACELAAKAWRVGKRVLISCESEEQALNIDEALWARQADDFVPHNLSGEVTTYATPIEITWAGKRNAQHRDLLISLQKNVPDFINSFNQIIDFVPVDETLKIQARERYRHYRQLGWHLETIQT